MKLRNKKTGEIGVLNIFDGKYQVIADDMPLCGNSVLGEYYFMTKLMQEWEDYEEPKELYIVDGRQSSCGGILKREVDADWYDHMIELGLGFRTNEELEQAIDKLKALQRLRAKGFKFKDWYYDIDKGTTNIQILAVSRKDVKSSDLDLLFGGE